MTERPLQAIDLQFDESNEAIALFGPGDANLKIIEEKLNVSLVTRGEGVSVSGNDQVVGQVKQVLQELLNLVKKGYQVTERDVVYAIQLAEQGQIEELSHLYEEVIAVNAKGKPIRVKTLGQKHYIAAMKSKDMVFAIGPAGTGKTFLAVVMAVNALKNGDIKKIILTRPAVEAGESLGFLPGDLKEKVDPYLRPLYDALHDILGAEHTMRLIERGTIEIAPLAYMRGRTLDDAYAILDEAQNTTNEQMKMFLTRLGFHSKMIVTGDITQVDLPKGHESGLKIARDTLKNINGISTVQLKPVDVVRHPLVQKVIEAYE
ncbi:PhoH family protein [Tuberibacillus sp. Marseille-P3662]|uniref:PhoH family protein n=1 Tax=Tuberibacillus sp. Marseille-P3662 TaxID=1965358 RepID=UPI000A1CD2DD|nr:PhoH family protein [Tuberibacillus sp. Marseille-P3662]